MIQMDVLVRSGVSVRAGAMLLSKPTPNLRVLTRQDTQNPTLYRVILEVLNNDGELRQVLLLTRTFSDTPDKQTWFADREIRSLSIWLAQISRGEEAGNSRLFSGAVAAGNFYITDMAAVMRLEMGATFISSTSAFDKFLESLTYE
jgi:hypothetical protein